MSTSLTADNRRKLHDVAVSTLTTCLYRKGFKNTYLHGVVAAKTQLNEVVAPHLDRPLEQLDPVEHAVLLLGAYELLFRPEVPWKVVVNESVSLTKVFGAEEGYKFVNGVLDKLARSARATEIQSGL